MRKETKVLGICNRIFRIIPDDMFYTYAHYKPGTNEIFYIGKGKGYRAHDKRALRRNPYWSNIVEKYGIDVVILQTWITEKAAFDHEIQLIKHYKSIGQAYCNLTDGGEGTSGYKRASKPMPKGFAERRTGKGNPHYKGPITAICVITGAKRVFHGDKELIAAGFTPSNVANCINHKEKHKTHKGHTFKREQL